MNTHEGVSAQPFFWQQVSLGKAEDSCVTRPPGSWTVAQELEGYALGLDGLLPPLNIFFSRLELCIRTGTELRGGWGGSPAWLWSTVDSVAEGAMWTLNHQDP